MTKLTDKKTLEELSKTDKFKAMVKEVALIVVEMEAKKQAPEVLDGVKEVKSPPYLLAILLIVLAGFSSATLIIVVRPDTEPLLIITTVFVSVASLTGAIAGAMQKNQILMEQHEANIKTELMILKAQEANEKTQLALQKSDEKSDLTLEESKATRSDVDGKMDKWKEEIIAAALERTKLAVAEALAEGERIGRDKANTRTDKLAGTNSE